MTGVEHVREVVAPVVTGLGLDLYDIEHEGGTLRVVVDRTDGVGIDEIAVATRLVSRALDEDDSISSAYTLEVSSPGLERTLRTPAHFAGAVGEKVSAKTTPEYEGDRRVTGSLTAADDEGIAIVLDDGTEVRLAYNDITKAKTVFEWGPSEKGGSDTHRPKKKETAA